MNKSAVKTFAINSRKKLIEDVEYKMSLIGIYENEINNPISSANGIETYQIGSSTQSIYDKDIERRKKLVKEVEQKGFKNVVEEVAYTWFNRIIAIRFLELKNYLPTKTRVLSSETLGKIEPDIITYALDIDLDYSQEDNELIFKLKDENKLDELFRFLFIKQCNKLNEILPGLFEKTDDYLELLLNISFTNKDGVIRQLIDTISEEDFISQVEIIGWLYQFYNTELKDETFANIKKDKVPKERIPAVTQLFTPDWIVKYMVENSLGRLWLEQNPNEELKTKWKYYVDEANQEAEVESELIKIKKESDILKPEDIKIIDPCMGSGHILVYIFDVLMDIYLSEGYTEKDSAENILKNNLYGLDIDNRAYQLAYFAVMMKARSYNRKILNKGISPLIYSIDESNHISQELIELISKNNPKIKEEIKILINSFKDAKNYGSMLNISIDNLDEIENTIVDLTNNKNDLYYLNYQNEIKILLNIIQNAKLLSYKYDVVVTNPPYMGNNNMNSDLKEFTKMYYPLSKTDLFAVFIEKGMKMVKEQGFNCMVTMQSWMFLSSFEKFRAKLIENCTISNLLHMDNMVMRIAFGTSATVFRKINLKNYNSTFYHVKLSDVTNDIVNPLFFNDENKYCTKISNFNLIPNIPIAYWLNEEMFILFKEMPSLNAVAEPRQGLATSNNKKFLRFWYEVDINNASFNTASHEDALKSNKKWFACTKGGSFRKWYGNNEYVVDWENNGQEMKDTVMRKYPYLNTPDFVIKNQKYYFRKGITWSTITNSKNSFRFCNNGFIPETKGSICYPMDNKFIYYILAFLNSSVAEKFFKVLSPTLDLHEGPLGRIPLIINEDYLNTLDNLSKDAIYLCKTDWDEKEISWDFKKHFLLNYDSCNLNESYNHFIEFKKGRFIQLKEIELNINQIFCEIYNLEFDLNVEDKFISITSSNYETDIRSFISYAVGCMFGRYSLDNEGLQFAGGTFHLDQYHNFIPDDDNIIPVLDSEYFEDDIVGRFVEFVKTCFGEESLEENLDFIANALAKNKKPSREKIRDYLLKNFFNDHKKSYKKCPIYWQFSSGKQNGFNCLVYMHRYEPSLVARIRTDYLHKTQKAIEQSISNCDNIINHSSSRSEITKATKDKTKLQKQLKETQEYDEALAHIANQNIEIDLDDGVKVNYAKFQNIIVSREGKKSKKINLLKKL